jgi:hypothetical protein
VPSVFAQEVEPEGGIQVALQSACVVVTPSMRRYALCARPNELRGVVSALSAYDEARATANCMSAVLGFAPVQVVSLLAYSWSRYV